MTYCIAPGCSHPQNPETYRVCQTCGATLFVKGRYRPIANIGKGGFGITFLACDEHIPSHPRCVIKQLHLQPDNAKLASKIVALFHQEAIRLEELGEHAQIPKLLAYFQADGQFYLVQEWIEGVTLAAELQHSGLFGEEKIWQLLSELLPVLQFIHDRHVIHRDIKPANIMRRVSPGGTSLATESARTEPNREIVLIDFGIAKLCASQTAQKTGTTIGTPEYMPPEQHKGKVFPASDLYSLGVSCVYLLTGVQPLELFDFVNDRWDWRSGLPTGRSVSDRLGGILDKLLHSALSQRYRSAQEVLQAMGMLPLSFPATQIQPSISPLQSAAGKAKALGLAAKPEREVNLTIGLDYKPLQAKLAAQQWQDADRETRRLLCQTQGKPAFGYLSCADIRSLPCQDLQTIDRLWVHYSRGHFGFSIQQQLYAACDRDYLKFCARVGWSIVRSSSPDRGLTFKRSSPAGHLPSRSWAGGFQWWQHIGEMADKLTQCNIC
jgi:serine/threonine protein kinase